jgi:hypothetical protein
MEIVGQQVIILNTARNRLGGAGTQTAGLAFGGGPSITGATEEYNGTTWATSPGSLNTARRLLGGAGIQTAALAFGGDTTPPNTGATEEYDGTSWTTSPLKFKYSKKFFSRLWHTNSRFSIWW